jgi:hypothetical protein
MTIEQTIWLAGFTDGEGYIGVTSKGTRFQAIIRIGTTHLATMQHVAELLDTKLTVRNSEHEIWKDCYFVALYDKKAEDLLRQLLPYLKTKKEQVLNVLEYRKTVKKGSNQYTPLEDRQEQAAAQKQYHTKSLILNKRGK